MTEKHNVFIQYSVFYEERDSNLVLKMLNSIVIEDTLFEY